MNPDKMVLLDNAIKDRLSQEEAPPYVARGVRDDYDGPYKYADIWDMQTCGLIDFTRETLGGFIGCDIPVEKWNLLGTIATDPLWSSPDVLSSCKLSFETLSTFVAALCGRYINSVAWMNYKIAQNAENALQMCLETIEKDIEMQADDYIKPITVTSTFITRDRLQSLLKDVPITLVSWRVFADIAANGITPSEDAWVTNDTSPSYNELNGFLCGFGIVPIPIIEWEQLKVECDLEFDALYIDDDDNGNNGNNGNNDDDDEDEDNQDEDEDEDEDQDEDQDEDE